MSCWTDVDFDDDWWSCDCIFQGFVFQPRLKQALHKYDTKVKAGEHLIIPVTTSRASLPYTAGNSRNISQYMQCFLLTKPITYAYERELGRLRFFFTWCRRHCDDSFVLFSDNSLIHVIERQSCNIIFYLKYYIVWLNVSKIYQISKIFTIIIFNFFSMQIFQRASTIDE